MIIPLNRDKKIILLKWLKQGFMDTLDLPEAYKDHTFFEQLLMEETTSTNEQAHQPNDRKEAQGL